MAAKTDWNPVLKAELAKPYWSQLQSFVRAERERHRVYPPPAEVFAALHLTPYADTRVVILGQDPYHGPGQAHGLCFSVRDGVALPPSLVNIYKELGNDLGIPPPRHGNLEPWARQGVLLLNTTLTVRARRRRVTPGQGLGDVHRRGHSRGQRQGASRRVHPLGWTRPPQAGPPRQSPRRHRVGPSVAVVGTQRVLRIETVLAHECGTGTGGVRADRLAAVARARLVTLGRLADRLASAVDRAGLGEVT